jgi:hypothetical protein
MKAFHRISIGIVISILSASHTFSAVLTFEEFSPPENDFINLSEDAPYNGVAFAFAAVSDQLVASHNHASDYWITDGTGPFVTQHSGHVALFNPLGANLDFATEQILTGLWVGRPNLGPTGVGGAEDLTLTAYAGDTPLASFSIHLTTTSPLFWDTSSLLGFSGITRYQITPAYPGLETGYFVADDFQFAPMSVQDLCPCEEAWKNHAEYVHCVRAAVSLLRDEASLTLEQAKDVIKHAHESDCGGKH